MTPRLKKGGAATVGETRAKLLDCHVCFDTCVVDGRCDKVTCGRCIQANVASPEGLRAVRTLLLPGKETKRRR